MATGGVITANAKNNMLKLLYGQSGTFTVSKLKVGTGTTTPTEEDTDIETDSGLGVLDPTSGYPQFDETNKKVTNRILLDTGQANGLTLSEVVEIDAAGATAASHDVFTGVVKDNTTELAIVITHQITT